MKKVISLLVAAAMLAAALPLLSFAETTEHIFTAVGAGHSGTASGTGLFIGAVGTGGTSTRAPYISGTTGNQNTVVGSARIGVLAFEVDGSIDPETISGATLNVHVNQINQNLGSNWMLLAAYETENPSLTYSVGGMDEGLFPAVDNDYSYEAAFWSDERCASSNLRMKTSAARGLPKLSTTKPPASIWFTLSARIWTQKRSLTLFI